jgi:hypothetical protein
MAIRSEEPSRDPLENLEEAVGEVQMSEAYNGMPSLELENAQWRKSALSSAQGNCVEVAKLPSGEIAMRNSRHPEGAALIFTHSEFAAFVQGAKDDDFGSLLR